jgi:hypothetical protein
MAANAHEAKSDVIPTWLYTSVIDDGYWGG